MYVCMYVSTSLDYFKIEAVNDKRSTHYKLRQEIRYVIAIANQIYSLHERLDLLEDVNKVQISRIKPHK